MKSVIEVEHLKKTYGSLVAVNDVSFAVAEGEIFGLLGPNGAGRLPLLSACRACAAPIQA
jgi:ABC-2 type transport system ATP-binding protein